MAEKIIISIPPIYEPVTDKNIRDSKKWTLRRNENAQKLGGLIEERLQDALGELARLAYMYNVPAEQFQFSADEDLREQVAQVMMDLEEEIMELMELYSLNATDDNDRRSTLLPWLAALSSKGADNLRQTLGMRLRQFLYDTEAQVAAMKMSGYDLTKALERIISTMRSVYSSAEVQSAYKKNPAAMYLRSRGVHYGNVGLSSSGAVNVINLGIQTATITWMKSQLLDFLQMGAVGYYQLRGSSYPCEICDDEVGIHVGDYTNDPYPHAHCMCYRVPLMLKTAK